MDEARLKCISLSQAPLGDAKIHGDESNALCTTKNSMKSELYNK